MLSALSALRFIWRRSTPTLDRMNILVRASIGPAALIVVNITTATVLTDNQRAGLYPPDSDSLGLPIGITWLASVLALLALALVAGSRRVRARAGGGTLLQRAAGTALVLGHASATLIAFAGLAYWLAPHHYTVALSYAAVLAWLAWEARTDVLKARGAGNAV